MIVFFSKNRKVFPTCRIKKKCKIFSKVLVQDKFLLWSVTRIYKLVRIKSERNLSMKKVFLKFVQNLKLSSDLHSNSWFKNSEQNVWYIKSYSPTLGPAHLISYFLYTKNRLLLQYMFSKIFYRALILLDLSFNLTVFPFILSS